MWRKSFALSGETGRHHHVVTVRTRKGHGTPSREPAHIGAALVDSVMVCIAELWNVAVLPRSARVVAALKNVFIG